MNKTTLADIVINVIFPLLFGVFIYGIAGHIAVPLVIKNYLPDGLWAYSFVSALLIAWDRRRHPLWLLIAFLLVIAWELLQHFSLIAGTPDIADVVIYLLFFGLALIVNIKLKPYYSPQHPIQRYEK